MNKLTKYLLALLSMVSMGSFAQESEVWNDFKKAKETGAEPILPDFSYAGYKFGEEGIPTVNYKVFDVTDYGAKPNDTKSDKKAFVKALAAAHKNGEGIVYFPKGKYYFNTGKDALTEITLKGSNIVVRGEGSGPDGSILFFDNDLQPKDPKKMYSVPKAIKTAPAGGGDKELTKIVADTRRETHSIVVEDASKIKVGDWVILKVKNNSPDLVEYDLQPLVPEPEWKKILNTGVIVNERHKVAKVEGNKITFVAPIHYDIQAKHNWTVTSYAHSVGVGFEDLTFEGNWTKDFKHHRSAQDDGGWGILSMSRVVDSWVRNCRFVNVTNAVSFSQSAASTAVNITIEGKLGHNSVAAAGGSTGILIAYVNDIAGMHHSAGVGGGSTTGTVVYRCTHPEHTSFESHASQPRCTLFDNIEGGFFLGRAGGARQNLPNHGRYLVLWNYNETDEAEENFEFWSTKTWYWKIVPPIIVGFHGSGTTFKTDEVQIIESLGTPVAPESLYEEQLKLRMGGKLPAWLADLKK